MRTYIALLRGVNVGGKNKVPMADLRMHLEEAGYTNVATYIASGNVRLSSKKKPDQVQTEIEKILSKKFKLDADYIKVLVLTKAVLEVVIKRKPAGFGEAPKKYHSDVIFLMDYPVRQALPAFSPREGVDTIWPGARVIYSQRLSAQRTKSRLNKIMSTPAYKHMTIRNWNTARKLLALISTS